MVELTDQNDRLNRLLASNKSDIGRSNELHEKLKGNPTLILNSDFNLNIEMLKESNELLKSMTTTYFIFIDFYKQVQEMGNHIICSSHD